MKGLILQGFPSLCMSWCGYEMVMLHFILPSVFFLVEHIVTKASLLAGAGLAFAMNWGRLDTHPECCECNVMRRNAAQCNVDKHSSQIHAVHPEAPI